jgi:hypothetical protein
VTRLGGHDDLAGVAAGHGRNPTSGSTVPATPTILRASMPWSSCSGNVVVVHHVDRLPQRRGAPHDVAADDGVQLDQRLLVGVEPARLVEDLVGDADPFQPARRISSRCAVINVRAAFRGEQRQHW